jgi:hypothetical protein
VYVKDQLGHHSIKITVDAYGHLVPGANKAAVDRLDQALIALGDPRHPTAPPWHQEAFEHDFGITDRAVTPREALVELRGFEPLTPRLPGAEQEHKLSKDKKRRSAKRGKK